MTITNISDYRKEKNSNKQVEIINRDTGERELVNGGIFQSMSPTNSSGEMSINLFVKDYKGFTGTESTNEKLDFLVDSLRDWLDGMVSHTDQLVDYEQQVMVNVRVEGDLNEYIMMFGDHGHGLCWGCGVVEETEEEVSS